MRHFKGFYRKHLNTHLYTHQFYDLQFSSIRLYTPTLEFFSVCVMKIHTHFVYSKDLRIEVFVGAVLFSGTGPKDWSQFVVLLPTVSVSAECF